MGQEEPSMESIHCLEFSRTPKSFHEALDSCTALNSGQDDVKSNHIAFKLESGTRLYLLPEQYESVLQVIAGMNLQSRHVVTTSSLIDTILETIATINSRDQVREKTNARQLISSEHAADSVMEKEKEREVEVSMLVKNSFIHIPVPSSLRASSSSCDMLTASTTDANPRNGRNPRRN